MASRLLEDSEIEEVWFVLSPFNPFKQEDALWPVSRRKALLELALKGMHGMQLCLAELDLPRPSYTIDTVRHLMGRYPEKNFVLFAGSDLLNEIHAWKESEQLLRLLPLYVYHRRGSDTPSRWQGRVITCPGPDVDISSTQIREYLATGKDISGMVPPGVRDALMA